ncbi:MAG: DUF969 domain-containing protein [Bacilli bacterium]
MQLIGILVVAVGFMFGFNTLLVVMVAGILTGLVAGLSFTDIMTLFGEFFIENRYMSFPIILTLPVIGILEKYGLKERAQTMISKSKNATAGRLTLLYMFVRQSTIALGINVGGHAQMIRPLIVPMAEAAARAKVKNLPDEAVYKIRAMAAASENAAYFFGQNLFVAAGSVLLMKGFFDSNGINIEIWNIALWAIPTSLIVFFVGAFRLWQLDRYIDRLAAKSSKEAK